MTLAPELAAAWQGDVIPSEGRVGVATDPVVAPADVASREFYCEHYHRLAAWTRTLVDDDETAHDIVAEAFTRLITKQRRIDDPRGYLYTIAVNLVRDHWRRTRRERRRLGELVALRPVHHAPPPEPLSTVRVLVDALPDKLRAPVLLHYYADMSVVDVARHLDRKVNTVKSDLLKARAVLRDALSETGGEDRS